MKINAYRFSRIQPPFKFRMLHGIVLVAGVAGCLSLRWTLIVSQGEISHAIREWRTTGSILLPASRVPKLIYESSPLMAVVTLTLLLLTLCPPRPRLSAMIRRPGFVALFVAAFTLLMVVGTEVFDHYASTWIFGSMYTTLPGRRDKIDLDFILSIARPLPGYAVASAWGMTWLGRRWRRAPNWLDTIGRGMGLYWIGMTLLVRFYPYLY
jgi:hypothetical protein